MLMSEMRDYFGPYADLLAQVKVLRIYNDDTAEQMREPVSEELKGEEKRSVALIVDDYNQVGHLISLLLDSEFDEVIACAGPDAAHTIMETKEITHLLCDYHLGAREGEVAANGYQFAAFWRREFESLERVVVFSNTDLKGMPKPEEIDEVVSKSIGPHAIADSLLVSKTPGVSPDHSS